MVAQGISQYRKGLYGAKLQLVPIFGPFDGGKNVIQCKRAGATKGLEGVKIRAKRQNFNEFGLFWP